MTATELLSESSLSYLYTITKALNLTWQSPSNYRTVWQMNHVIKTQGQYPV